jgi:membrane protein
MKALIGAMNIAYSEAEQRSFLKLNALALLFTLGAIVFGLISLIAIVALPALFRFLALPDALQTLFSIGRWPLLAILIIVAISVVYRYAPARTHAKWRWIGWGAALATLLWIIGSLAFSFFVSNFGSYNETYGSIGAIMVLLLWFFLSAYAVLLGAELDAELEHQTRLDSTVGERRPMGERGAYVADTLGESP